MEKKKNDPLGVKIIVKRPKLHYAIIIVYVLAPIVNLLLIMILGRIPLGTVIQRYFQGFGYLAGIWLFTAPLVGIGLYLVHRVSWYIFLGHSSQLAGDAEVAQTIAAIAGYFNIEDGIPRRNMHIHHDFHASTLAPV